MMSKIRSITKHIRHQQWADEINERIRSGEPVRDWCARHGVSYEAYKYRLRVVRLEALSASPAAFAELREPAGPACSPLPGPAPEIPSGDISIELNGAVIRFGPGTAGSLILAAVKAVRDA